MENHSEPLTVPLPEATRIFGLSRSTLLRAGARGDIEIKKVLGRNLVVVKSLKKLIGLEGEATA
jgi:hypothetical protein